MTASDHVAPKTCRVTLVTSSGRGAIATISLDGTNAAELVEQFFRPLARKSMRDVPVGAIVIGHWQSSDHQVEEVVVAKRSPSCFEINCHGGATASEAILTSLSSAGAIRVSGEQWLLHHVPDAIQRSAWQCLLAARTTRTAGILLDQYRGALNLAVREIITKLRGSTSDLERANERVERLLRFADLGTHLSKPWGVVLAGAPNVGKSSLLNALLGYERSIVFDQAGTTRDVLTATTALDGWLFELSDTAGQRESDDVLEREGTRRARQQLQQADLTLIVVDASQFDVNQLECIQKECREFLVVANKIDLCQPSSTIPAEWFPTSAIHGTGLQLIKDEIVRRLVPYVPGPGEAVPFTEEHRLLLRDARTAIHSGNVSRAVLILESLRSGAAVSSPSGGDSN